MREKIMELIYEYRNLEEKLYNVMVESWNDEDITAWHRVDAKLEVLEYLIYYYDEVLNNGISHN